MSSFEGLIKKDTFRKLRLMPANLKNSYRWDLKKDSGLKFILSVPDTGHYQEHCLWTWRVVMYVSINQSEGVRLLGLGGLEMPT